MFNAIMIDKTETEQTVGLKTLEESALPEGDVMVDIDYSTINYKDALAVTNSAPIARTYPLVPGIDFAGTVTSSSHADYKAGDKVILNGWGVGEQYWGGLAQKAKVNGDFLVPLPSSFTTRQAMAIGTAGYTAMLCVLALEGHGVTPDKGEIVVTGASGGVGSVAIATLAKLGYKVVAVTGKPDEGQYLLDLGAAEILDRATLSEPGRPLSKERWAGAVDTVGSHILANICASTKYNGVVTACGLAAGMDLPLTVMPFILRGVCLQGVESVVCPKERRILAWSRLATDLDPDKLSSMVNEIGLSEVIDAAPKLMNGTLRGRFIVDVNR